MALITDAAAVAFSNQEARPAADALAQCYYTCKGLLNDWNALGMSSKIVNTTDRIDDDSDLDGRNSVTGQQVTSIITRAQEFVDDYEQFSNAKLNTVLQVCVNHQPKF
jgi:hypothetical protein